MQDLPTDEQLESQCIVLICETNGRVDISDEAMEQLAEMGKVLKTQIIVLSHFPTEYHSLIVEQIAAMEHERARAAVVWPVSISMGADMTNYFEGFRRATEGFELFNRGVEKLSIDIKRLSEEIDAHKPPAAVKAPKPYQQRGFYVVPGSRQSRYC